MNISRENETNNIESELKRRIKQWAEQEGLEVPKDFEQIAELTKIIPCESRRQMVQYKV